MGIAQDARLTGPPGQSDVLMNGLATPDREESLAGRKRAAVELVRSHDAALRSSARRFSICQEDAEDAYQRGIEILLSKAPTTDPRQLLPWARTVIKHEALAIRKARERMLGRPPGAERVEQNEDWVHLIPWQGSGPEERVEGRELIDRSREALATLKPHELKALTQLAEGYSYSEIASLNGWTRTKVNRCLAEGRARFRSVFRQSETGERCAALEPLLSACCDGELEGRELIEIRNHLAACGQCRATLRAFRALPKAAALLPVVPGSHSLWERVQEFALSAQIRFQGIGKEPEQAFGMVAGSGGTRGVGVAALAKIATICVGTAGGAAACVAGVLPTPGITDRPQNPVAIERPAAQPEPVASVWPEPASQGAEAPATGAGRSPGSSDGARGNGQEAGSGPAPDPTPVEQEFTAEAGGTPAPASAPPPAPTVSTSSSAPRVPIGGGGEFGP
ncbi:MAG: sigma-70 family RNA polymerase sigma factor [Solirubrobacterales bacterium]